MTEEQFREALGSLPFQVDAVAVRSEGVRLIGVVVSTHFDGLDEAERQRIVWAHLLQLFDARQLTPIEFVFTNTPQEDAEIAESAVA